MSVETRVVTKSHFQTGDKPTEAQFVNLIDSAIWNEDYAANNSVIFKNSAGVITSLTVGTDRILGRKSSGEIVALTGAEALAITGGGSGTVTSVSGTVNRITSSGGATPVIDISASYVGQTSITTLGTISTGNWQADTIAVGKGGTGQTSYTVGDLLVANSATSFNKLADVATGSVLLSGGVATQPSYGKVGLTTHVSGILPSANGGTGVDNSTRTITVNTNNAILDYSGAFTLTVAANASVSGTNTGDQTTVTGNAGSATVLQTSRNINGVAFNGSADITVTAAAGTLTGTTLNAAVVTSSLTAVGTIGTGTWQGTVIGLAYGGTNKNITPVNGGIVWTDADSMEVSAAGTANQLLASGGAGAPTWLTVGTGLSISGSTLSGLGYTLSINSANQATTTDGQTIYFGGISNLTPGTVAGLAPIYVLKAGTIKVITVIESAATPGSNEAWVLNVRLNNTTSTLIASVANTNATRVWTNNALNIAVVYGDFLEIESVQPTWATNPAQVRWGGHIYIE